MNDNIIQRLQEFFDSKTEEELRILYPFLCVACNMLAEQLKEDKDERIADL